MFADTLPCRTNSVYKSNGMPIIFILLDFDMFLQTVSLRCFFFTITVPTTHIEFNKHIHSNGPSENFWYLSDNDYIHIYNKSTAVN